jgi:hypothetical protein
MQTASLVWNGGRTAASDTAAEHRCSAHPPNRVESVAGVVKGGEALPRFLGT